MSGKRGPAYLAVCTLYRDAAPYLEEWIEFHRLVGVERFFLYDNRSVDEHRELLEPYVREGVVVAHDWPHQFPKAQVSSAEHCLTAHRDEARWVAVLDVDEFFFSPTGRPLPEVLSEYEDCPAVAVNMAMYGTSGHRTRPAGLVTESYLWRTSLEHMNRRFQSIIDPARVASCRANPHTFNLTEGVVVDELRRTLPPGRKGPVTESISWERLRINHYWTRSEEEWREKFKIRQQSGRPRARKVYENVLKGFNDVHDDVITRYAPGVHAALARRRG